VDQADRWEIDQDDFGRPLVRHRHPTETLPTFITRDADGILSARCPCSEELRLASPPARGLRRTSDDWKPTGVWDAVLIDVLLGTGLDLESVSAMSAQERVDAVRSAVNDGQLDESTVEMLRGLGIFDEGTA
jgi:hypothetical protein